MRRVGSALLLLAATVLTTAATTVPAAAAEGEVIVFETELQPLTTYENPVGCIKLPVGSHVLANRTDRPVQVYADPFCMTPSVTVPPGHGSHLAAGTGSFSA
ncbi:hypothetical protein [Streptomyces olivaceiscleroticus]|uniref:Secreted protein n=1 Tax=Streptomyces olivaceiscleroticus TaxID=68245 RepID=A0ABP3JA77_9ACTN